MEVYNGREHRSDCAMPQHYNNMYNVIIIELKNTQVHDKGP